jgi:hypothetical protein
MSSPIYVPPDSVTYTMAPDKYQKLLAALHGNAKVSNLAVQSGGGLATVQGVDFAWSYESNSRLRVTIVKKHGFITSHVPNATIFDELNAQFISLI